MAIKIVKSGITIGVMTVPYRTQRALYIQYGNNVKPVAYFKKELDAKEFERILDSMAFDPTAKETT